MDNCFYEEQKPSNKFIFLVYLLKYLWVAIFFELVYLVIMIVLKIPSFDFFWVATSFFFAWILLVLIYQVLRYKREILNLFIEVNENLKYGFNQKSGIFSQTIDFDDIKTIRLAKRNHFQIHFSKRTLYCAKTGYFIEIDWNENKIGGFSIINHKVFLM